MFTVRHRQYAFMCLGVVLTSTANAQTSKPVNTSGDKFPYAFTNFVWWSDSDLRIELKRQIPSLEDELIRSSPLEAKVRTTLVKLLREKGVIAEVQSFEPPIEPSKGVRDPDAPPLSILFSVASPPDIIVEKVVLENAPSDALKLLDETAASTKGKPYNANGLWYQKKQFTQNLQQVGFLAANVVLKPGLPSKESGRYLVPLQVAIDSGAQYHVSSIKADGGPLVQGRDLSPYFALKPGDVATMSAFGRLAGSLRSVYWHAGYPDVEFEGAPVLDTVHALAAYQLRVITGPQYHMRSLAIQNLNEQQQAIVRAALGLKSGNVYDALAVSNLNRKIVAIPELAGYNLSYTPREDKQAHEIDLTLNFYKQQ